MAVILEDAGDAPTGSTTPYSIQPGIEGTGGEGTVGDVFEGTITGRSDQDWVEIFLDPGRAYSFSVHTTFVGYSVDVPLLALGVRLPGGDSTVMWTAILSVGVGGTIFDPRSGGIDAEGFNDYFPESNHAFPAYMIVTGAADDIPFDYSISYERLGYRYNPDPGDQTVMGSHLSDVFSARGGAHLIYGRDGDDTINVIGFGGDDTIISGNGDDRIMATDGNDYIHTGNGDDHAIGGRGNDRIFGMAGNDVLDGGTGDDKISGGAGDDRLWGDSGNNTISGGAGNDTIIDRSRDHALLAGGGGHDFILAGGGDVTISGGGGNDTLAGGTGTNTIYGGNGNDVISGGRGADLIYGGNHNDTFNVLRDQLLSPDSAIDTLNGGSGYDRVDFAYEVDSQRNDFRVFQVGNEFHIMTIGGIHELETWWVVKNVEELVFSDGVIRLADIRVKRHDANETLVGTTGDDTLDGFTLDDHLSGLAGNDVLIAGTGNDTLLGGAGNDTLVVGYGDNVLDGGSGVDTADYSQVLHSLSVYLGFPSGHLGAASGDTIIGIENVIGSQYNRNYLVGNTADNFLVGGQGRDSLSGKDGDDRLKGLSGDDTLNGGNGNDLLLGGADNDRLIGGVGDDRLYGSAGNDFLIGGDGQDTLDGGNQNDRLTGGLDADTFQFGAGFGADLITDFQPGTDILRLDDILWTGSLSALQVLQIYGDDSSGKVVLDFGSGNSITLNGISSLSGLEADISIF